MRIALSVWYLTICVGVWVCVLPYANAQNLVKNPGFEETDSCWFGLGIFPPDAGPKHWYSANVTPDHLQSCLPYGAVNGLPLNFMTFQHPYEGNSCVGMITYHYQGPTDQQREWLQSELIEPLVPGETYYCSFRANAAFGGNAQYPQFWLANDKIGMLFTMDDREWIWGMPKPPPPDYAHVYYPEILSDTIGWTLVSGSFVADSAYGYIMIGQFFNNALTDTLHFAPPGDDPWYWFPWGYTLIDAVCVSPHPSGCDMGVGMDEPIMTGPAIYPNPARDQLVLAHQNGSEVQVLDAVGRVIWAGRITNDRWVVEVGGWPRGTYVLRSMQQARVEAYKFVLAE